jgi:O-antigen/teichoic acid export membrane protein
MSTVNKQKMILVLSIIGLIANVIINIFLIQKYGYVDAALATVDAEGLVFCLLVLIAAEYKDRTVWWKAFIEPLLAVLMPLAIIEVFMLPNSPIARAVIFNVAFVLLLAALRVFNDGERRFLGDLIASVRLQLKIG